MLPTRCEETFISVLIVTNTQNPDTPQITVRNFFGGVLCPVLSLGNILVALCTREAIGVFLTVGLEYQGIHVSFW